MKFRGTRKKKGAVSQRRALKTKISTSCELSRRVLAIVFIVVAIVPVPITAPSVSIFVPPTVIAAVAVLASLMQIVTGAVRLGAVVPVMFNRLMQAMVRFTQPLLAIVSARTRDAGE
jgi:hypothetical protein